VEYPKKSSAVTIPWEPEPTKPAPQNKHAPCTTNSLEAAARRPTVWQLRENRRKKSNATGRPVADASGGLATGLYWVATGKFPIEDLEDDAKDDPKLEQPKDPHDEQDSKRRCTWKGE
jgi:hypothetical protein